MVELAPPVKKEEECPLLKVEGGSGDGSGQQPPPTIDPVAWSVSCPPKRSWFDRWPEFLTACWMTGILLAISFLGVHLYSTIGTVRRQSIVVHKSNATKPSSEVYYHQIIQRQNSPSFLLYSDYLANMAVKHPHLHFNVIFMIDDTFLSSGRGLRHTKIYIRPILLHPARDLIANFEYHNSMEISEFKQKYQNVNITAMPLSKFMAQTQLKYKWKTIPLWYLTFYARIFSVWQTGGIGMDLALFNNRFINRKPQDRRITTILKQHNDGINSDNYRQALDTIKDNEVKQFISTLFGIINQMINQTTTFLNSSFWFPQFNPQKDTKSNQPLVRQHRNKREVNEKNISDSNTNWNDTNDTHNITTDTTRVLDTEKNDKASGFNASSIINNVNNTNNKFVPNISNKEHNNGKTVEKVRNIDEIDYDLEPNMYMTYQISLISDDLGLIFMEHPKLESMDQRSSPVKLLGNSENIKVSKDDKTFISIPYLTMMNEGSFVASTTFMHPLLGHILSGGCKRMPPKIIIDEAFLSLCSEVSKANNLYCDNIYLLVLD